MNIEVTNCQGLTFQAVLISVSKCYLEIWKLQDSRYSRIFPRKTTRSFYVLLVMNSVGYWQTKTGSSIVHIFWVGGLFGGIFEYRLILQIRRYESRDMTDFSFSPRFNRDFMEPVIQSLSNNTIAAHNCLKYLCFTEAYWLI